MSEIRWLRQNLTYNKPHQDNTHRNILCHVHSSPQNVRAVVLVAQLASRHSCVADRLLVVVRFPRLSFSVRGVGNGGESHRLGCTAASFHWRDPVALSVGQSGTHVSSKGCAHRSWVSFSDWMVTSWPTRWVSLFWIPRLTLFVALYWDEDTREVPEQFCRYFSAWRPMTVHVWEIALQLQPQAVSCTMFCWLYVVPGMFSFRPGTVFMSIQRRTWWVAPRLVTYQWQSGRQQHTLPAHESTVRYTVISFSLWLNTWTRTCERTLRG